MNVREFQIRRQALELEAPLWTARGELRVREGAVIELTDGALVGLGEATPLQVPWVEVLDDSLRALTHAAGALVGESLPEDPEGIDRLLSSEPALDGAPAARQALECALLDLAARRRGLPLRRLLWDRARDVVPANALLLQGEPGALAEEARQAVAEGFGTLKLKVGGDAEDERLRMAAVRAAVGPGVRIRIDANGGWREDEAGWRIEALARLDVELCEQPVPAAAVSALRALRGRVPCRIAADESLGAPGGVDAVLAEPPAADLVVLKPMALGGLWRSLRIARRAHALGVGSYVTSSLDGPVALAAAAELAAALPTADWACGLGTARLFAPEVRRAGPELRGGAVRLRALAGLGVEGRAP